MRSAIPTAAAPATTNERAHAAYVDWSQRRRPRTPIKAISPASAMRPPTIAMPNGFTGPPRSEEHTSELQSHVNLVCRLLLEKTKTYSYCSLKKKKNKQIYMLLYSFTCL